MAEALNLRNVVARLHWSQQRCRFFEKQNTELSRRLQNMAFVLDQVIRYCSQHVQLEVEDPPCSEPPWDSLLHAMEEIKTPPAPVPSTSNQPTSSFEVYRLPRAVLSRFIGLLDSSSLRRLSHSSKFFYTACTSIRGVEVQALHLTSYIIVDRPLQCTPLANGRLEVDLYPNSACPNLLRILPHLRPRSLVHDQSKFDSKTTNIPPNYSHFHGIAHPGHGLQPFYQFLHDRLESVELTILKTSTAIMSDVVVMATLIKAKTLAVYLYNCELDEHVIRQLLTQNKHPGVQQLHLHCSKNDRINSDNLR